MNKSKTESLPKLKERNLQKMFNPIDSDTDIKKINQTLKDVWRNGFKETEWTKEKDIEWLKDNPNWEEKYPNWNEKYLPLWKFEMSLAHGYSHAIQVANESRILAKCINPDLEKDAFIAGLIHEIYRPITGDNGGIEPHSKLSAIHAEYVLIESKIADDRMLPDRIKHIVDAIGQHGVGDFTEIENPDDLTSILFLADKKIFNIERVMAYVYDLYLTPGAFEKKFPRMKASQIRKFSNDNNCQSILFMDRVLTNFSLRMSLTQTALCKFTNTKFEPYTINVFETYINTMEELLSQRNKEKRNDDSEKTILTFWAIKEGITNFTYLLHSEQSDGLKSDELWESIDLILHKYNQLILTSLKLPPFSNILRFRDIRRRYE